LPSRLVDVNGNGKKHTIKLVETSEGSASSITAASQSYIALSYCRGTMCSKGDFENGEQYRTTFQNIERRKAGFSELDLPPTIRDAVTITRRLGFKYLWADALCILQGTDPKAAEDWASEASRMHHIYGNASLTIAAASAASAYDGIFDSFKYRSESAPVEINLCSGHSQIGQGSAFSTLLVPLDSRDMPLYHRGWTLQERILSPRVITYTCDQLLWECQTTTLTQKGLPMEFLHTSRLSDNCSAGELQDRWQVLVTDYSARDLSLSTDKSPALSGLAQAFEVQLQDDEYLGGVWRRSLLDDLLWVHKPVSIGRQTVQRRPSEYRAPSWSWASIDGNVRWIYAYANREGPYWAKLIDAWTLTKGHSKFGEVQSGRLKLEGPLRRMGIVDNKHSNVPFGCLSESFENEAEHFTNFYLDVATIADPNFATAQERQDIFILLIKKDIALLLQRIGDALDTNMVFKRIGLVSKYAWLNRTMAKEKWLFHETRVEIK
jgi:hypothetical protein